jgi:DNA-binding transcriptional ArsR family regulator
MTYARDLAGVARLLGDESRATMCLAMLDRSSWTVSELAAEAAIGRAAASEHVRRLVDGGLVSTERQGRNTYVRLAGPRVAEVVERLAAFGEPEPPRSLNAARERERLKAARTCYDHLAGRLGVAVHDAMLHGRLLQRRGGLRVTGRGRDWFAGLGVDLDEAARHRRVFIGDCLDLTERRPHLSGHVGAVLCETFLAREWVRRTEHSRAVVLTQLGERALGELLAISAADLAVA